jgi:hypothetical protein
MESFPKDSVVRFNYLPTLRAKIALAGKNTRQALDELEVAAPYEIGNPGGGFYSWSALYPVYWKGEAYLSAHRGSEAAAEFEPIAVLARLGAARSYVLQDDRGKGRAAYQDFLTLWKDADADIPIRRPKLNMRSCSRAVDSRLPMGDMRVLYSGAKTGESPCSARSSFFIASTPPNFSVAWRRASTGDRPAWRFSATCRGLCSSISSFNRSSCARLVTR